MRRLSLLIGVLMIGPVVIRARSMMDASSHRSAVKTASSPKENGLPQTPSRHFDPDAEVILFAGADGLPGRAEIDDDFNGIVDDPSELGAFRSDDVCLTPNDPTYLSVRSGQASWKVISRGSSVISRKSSVDPLELLQKRSSH
ncbi:hypothetical protein CA13_34660 [Planctomycetes bacterium CA13]|uniref:Uncharacterized protein n=1 Tax=Novipirellula herctigrandis TaxID=2527986 RepID=A0A5C5Z5B4_9BACT|nr:hypothetical protein CA13_34660 [Planctomycetes bacterium CA13]